MQLTPDDVSLARVSGPLSAVVHVPGSKSIANRALLIAALADGRSMLDNLPAAMDVRVMRDALQRLNIPIESLDPLERRVAVTGHGGMWHVPEAHLDVADAGTAFRFLLAAACLGHGEIQLAGSARLRERPIAGLIDALRALGARIDDADIPDRWPITVHASGLRGGRIALDDPQSSQFVSALMMVAPHARQDVLMELRGDVRSRPYIDMTRRVMEAFGASVLVDGDRMIIPAGQRYTGRALTVEPDASGAAVFLVAAALAGGCVTIPGLGRESLQGDIRILELLTSMGCRVERSDSGDATVHAPADGRIRPLDADLRDTPDLAPPLAVAAAFADGVTRLRGIGQLRLKESDRIGALAQGLSRLSAEVEIHDDGLTIHAAAHPTPAIIASFGDHRIAMSFALAATRLDGIVIRGATCVDKSFPDFWPTWRAATNT